MAREVDVLPTCCLVAATNIGLWYRPDLGSSFQYLVLGECFDDILRTIFVAPTEDSVNANDAADVINGLFAVVPWRWSAAAPKESMLCIVGEC